MLAESSDSVLRVWFVAASLSPASAAFANDIHHSGHRLIRMIAVLGRPQRQLKHSGLIRRNRVPIGRIYAHEKYATLAEESRAPSLASPNWRNLRYPARCHFAEPCAPAASGLFVRDGRGLHETRGLGSV